MEKAGGGGEAVEGVAEVLVSSQWTEAESAMYSLGTTSWALIEREMAVPGESVPTLTHSGSLQSRHDLLIRQTRG